VLVWAALLARRSIAAFVLAAVVIAGFITPAAAEKPLAFPDGVWHGTAYFTGSLTDPGDVMKGSGSMTFTMKVKQGELSGGSMEYRAEATSTGDVDIEASAEGSFDLSGPATRIDLSGLLRAEGTATYGGATIPLEMEVPVEGDSGLRAKTVSCNRVEGEFTARHESALQDGGLDASFASEFVAVRSNDPQKVKEIFEAHQGLLDEAEAIAQKAKEATDPQTKAALTAQLKLVVAQWSASVDAAIANLGACEGPPAGFVPGMADQLWVQIFHELIHVLGPASPGPVPALDLLRDGVRSGGAGVGLPGIDADPETAEEHIDVLQGWLTADLQGADRATAVDILVQAQMYGLDGLAGSARASLGDA